MNSAIAPSVAVDEELSLRLKRLSSSRKQGATAPEPSTDIDATQADRLAQLSNRKNLPTPQRPEPSSKEKRRPMQPGRRRHAARKSRIASLVLSLATTAGLTTGFAAMDGPSSAIVAAEGGMVTASSTDASATTVDGDAYINKWGPVQVQATFGADGQLTSVDAVQVPFAYRKSIRTNDRVVPILNRQALSGQAAQVDTVSGATYTSIDYERSLQSAIDTARAANLTELL